MGSSFTVISNVRPNRLIAIFFSRVHSCFEVLSTLINKVAGTMLRCALMFANEAAMLNEEVGLDLTWS